MYNTRLVIKNPSKKTGRAKIHVEIEFKTANKKERIYIPTLESIQYKNWRAGKISKAENNSLEIKQRIDQKHEEVRQQLYELDKTYGYVNADLYRNELEARKEPEKDILAHLNDFLALKRLTAKPALVKKLITIRNHLKGFSNGRKLYLHQVNQQFVMN